MPVAIPIGSALSPRALLDIVHAERMEKGSAAVRLQKGKNLSVRPDGVVLPGQKEDDVECPSGPSDFLERDRRCGNMTELPPRQRLPFEHRHVWV
jgi:hypothetical protein